MLVNHFDSASEVTRGLTAIRSWPYSGFDAWRFGPMIGKLPIPGLSNQLRRKATSWLFGGSSLARATCLRRASSGRGLDEPSNIEDPPELTVLVQLSSQPLLFLPLALAVRVNQSRARVTTSPCHKLPDRVERDPAAPRRQLPGGDARAGSGNFLV